MGIISTFLRAIRAGAIHPNHSAVLLNHHGRLGVAFDHCSKIIVDVLREEGMYKGHGDVVVSVITSALKDVSISTFRAVALIHSLSEVFHIASRGPCT
jgi:cohesin complex subunit SA-1/2